MSDRPIQAGDLVVVTRWLPCGCGLGKIGKVASVIDTHAYIARCWKCNSRASFPHHIIAELDAGFKVALSWLKRIDPPALEDETERGEELTV